jgi:methyl-accepting chemotaxis protein
MFANYHLINTAHRREYYRTLTEKMIKENKDIHSIWANFNANDFDGLDKKYVGDKYYSDNGRFNICYKINFAARRPTVEFFNYSSVNKQNITKPTLLINNIDDNPIISFCLPVFDNENNIIGTTGIDVDLKYIASLLNKSKMGLAKDLTLLTKDGTYLFHSNSSLIGTNIRDNKQYANNKNYIVDSILNTFTKNEDIIIRDLHELDDIVTIIYHHLKIVNMFDLNIYVCVIVRSEIISIDTSSFVIMAIQYSFVLMVLYIISIFFLSTVIENIFANKIIAELDKKYLENH